MEKAEWITVPYLAKVSGVGESTIWQDIKILQSLLHSDAQAEGSAD
ncbi:MAG: hypothetical protein ACLQEQ_07930 [Nitrososphaerales archaeon]